MDSNGRDISISYEPRARKPRDCFTLAIAGVTSALIGATAIATAALFSHPDFPVPQSAGALLFGVLAAAPLSALIFGFVSLVESKVDRIGFQRNPFAFVSLLSGAFLIAFEILWIHNH